MELKTKLLRENVLPRKFQQCIYTFNEDYMIEYNLKSIQIYKLKENDSCQKNQISEIITLIEFHPFYKNVFGIGTQEGNIILYEILENPFRVSEEKLIIKAHQNEIISFKFNPNNKYEKYITSCAYDNTVKIFQLNNSYCLKKISLNDTSIKIKWINNGKNIACMTKNKIINIFDINDNNIENKELYSTEDYLLDFEINDDSQILIILMKKYIILYDIKNNSGIKTIDLKSYLFKEIFLNENYFFLFLNDNLQIFKLKSSEKLKEFDIEFDSIKKIENENNKFLLYVDGDISSITICDNDNKNKLNEKNDNINFWDNNIYIISNIPEMILKKNNIVEEISQKKYFRIEEIKKILKEIKDINIFQRRLNVQKYINMEKTLTYSKEIYLELIKLLLQDNTNQELLILYLNFIKKWESDLKNDFGDGFEKFKDEIIYYSVCFNKEDYNNYFQLEKKSEKEKIIELLGSLEKKEEIKNYLKEDFCIFNQPILYSNKELYFYQIRINLISQINEIYEQSIDIQKKSLGSLRTLSQLLLDGKYFDSDLIINSQDRVDFLSLIIFNILSNIEYKISLNLLTSKNNNDNDLLKYTISKDNIVYNNKCFRKYEVCLNNLHYLDKIDESFIYNFDYLLKNPPLKIDISKIKYFIKEIMLSNTFKEAFNILYGKDEKYPFDNNNIEIFINDYIKFYPYLSHSNCAQTNKFTMISYISTNVKNIETNKKDIQNIELINECLIYGSIIEILIHEVNHLIYILLFFTNNCDIPFNTPRKNDFNINEGGNLIELLFFGSVLRKISVAEALFILNIKNYNLSLSKFRDNFNQLNINDLKIEGIFSGFNEILNQENDYTIFSSSIKNKLSDNNKISENIIRFEHNNDVIGRIIKENQLEECSYFYRK